MAVRGASRAGRDPGKLPSRNAQVVQLEPRDEADSLRGWAERYRSLAVHGVRSEEVEAKIALHLERFLTFFIDAYGHDRASACLRRDVAAWRRALVDDGLAPATVNNHLASLGGFTAWVSAQAPGLFANGNPSTGVGGLALPPLEPRALSADQVRSLKNLCDRLPRLGERKGRRWVRQAGAAVPIHAHSRPWRDRAIVYLLLSTGLRRGPNPSSLGRALVELGRIIKTLHVLDYCHDPDYRRAIHRILVRGESRNSLARDTFHGRRGQLRQHYQAGQENQLGALGLMVNVIVLWQTVYIQAALDHLVATGHKIDPAEVARLSPLGHPTINLNGRYRTTGRAPSGGLRPLRSAG